MEPFGALQAHLSIFHLDIIHSIAKRYDLTILKGRV